LLGGAVRSLLKHGKAMINEEIAALRLQMQEHVALFEQHEKDELRRHLEFKREQEANRDRIDRLCHSTESLVVAWEALGGAVKLGIWVGRFLKWAGGLAIISSALAWTTKHIG